MGDETVCRITLIEKNFFWQYVFVPISMLYYSINKGNHTYAMHSWPIVKVGIMKEFLEIFFGYGYSVSLNCC